MQSCTIFVKQTNQMAAINLLNQYFEKIYILTIKSMEERHALLEKNLAGLQYNLFFGLYKNEIELKSYVENGLYNNEKYLQFNKDGKEIRLGVFCCAMGHRAIYEDMVANNIKTALILEDDALIIQNNIAAIPKILNELPATWELLYLGYEKNDNYGIKQWLKSKFYQIFPRHTLLKIKPNQYKKYYAKPLTAHIWQSGFHDCTHAYAVTLTAAKKLITLQTPVVFKSDTLLSFAVSLNKVEAYIAKPKIFDQLSIQQNATIASLVADN